MILSKSCNIIKQIFLISICNFKDSLPYRCHFGNDFYTVWVFATLCNLSKNKLIFLPLKQFLLFSMKISYKDFALNKLDDNNQLVTTSLRRNCSQMFFKIGVLKNFAIFTGKPLCLSLIFNKIAGLQPCNFIKKRLQHMCFPVKFEKSLGTLFLQTPLVAVSQPAKFLQSTLKCARC